MKKFSFMTLAALFVITPVMAMAQTGGAEFGEIGGFVTNISKFINGKLIPLVIGIALLFFIYGIFKYFILGGGDETKREEGRQLMLYSIIGFVVMVSIFGIVNMISSGLGFTGSGNDTLKSIPNVPGGNT